MSVQLSQPDFQQLTTLLADLDDFATVSGRVRLATEALEGAPRGRDLLRQLDLDGTRRGVAVELVRRLATFGRVTPDKEALGVLVNYVLSYQVGEDDNACFLRMLQERYSLDRPLAPQPSLDDWRGRETDASMLEKIIGEDTLRPIAMLEQALAAAESVVQIESPLGLGSGFVVADRLVMTNHHVIGTADQARGSIVKFNYQLDGTGDPKPFTAIRANGDGAFFTDPDLDVTIFELAESAPVPALPLRPARVGVDGRVAIIQHPGGSWKKISLQNNFVQYADDRYVQYTTSTRPGSSGSPVFDDDFRVVALHHAGGNMTEPSTQRRYLRNEGISMIAIVRAVKANAPQIHSELTIV